MFRTIIIVSSALITSLRFKYDAALLKATMFPSPPPRESSPPIQPPKKRRRLDTSRTEVTLDGDEEEDEAKPTTHQPRTFILEAQNHDDLYLIVPSQSKVEGSVADVGYVAARYSLCRITRQQEALYSDEKRRKGTPVTDAGGDAIPEDIPVPATQPIEKIVPSPDADDLSKPKTPIDSISTVIPGSDLPASDSPAAKSVPDDTHATPTAEPTAPSSDTTLPGPVKNEAPSSSDTVSTAKQETKFLFNFNYPQWVDVGEDDIEFQDTFLRRARDSDVPVRDSEDTLLIGRWRWMPYAG